MEGGEKMIFVHDPYDEPEKEIKAREARTRARRERRKASKEKKIASRKVQEEVVEVKNRT